LKETIKRIFPDDPKFIEKIQSFKENLMNKSSQFSSFKNNFFSEKRITLGKNSIEDKEPKMPNQVEKIKRNFSVVETKHFKHMCKSMTLNLNRNNNQKETSHKSQIELENVNRMKFKEKNPISEQTLENDLKQTNEDLTIPKTYYNNKEKDKVKRHAQTSNEFGYYEVAKIVKNNLQKFIMSNNTNKKYPTSSSNYKPYIGYDYKTNKNKTFMNLSNRNYQSQINLSNPKIKIKISPEVSEKIKNSNEYLTNKKGNFLFNSFDDNPRKNISININNKITNFYHMGDLTNGYDDIGNMKIKKITEEDIQRKLAVYRTKLNSEMLRLLNEEKMKENDRQVLYENIKDIDEKYIFEKEVSKERLESSDKIVKLNQ